MPMRPRATGYGPPWDDMSPPGMPRKAYCASRRATPFHLRRYLPSLAPPALEMSKRAHDAADLLEWSYLLHLAKTAGGVREAFCRAPPLGGLSWAASLGWGASRTLLRLRIWGCHTPAHRAVAVSGCRIPVHQLPEACPHGGQTMHPPWQRCWRPPGIADCALLIEEDSPSKVHLAHQHEAFGCCCCSLRRTSALPNHCHGSPVCQPGTCL